MGKVWGYYPAVLEVMVWGSMVVYPTTDIQPPSKPDLKKSPRLQFLDTGLANYICL